jgi:L-rhamnose mutarotase
MNNQTIVPALAGAACLLFAASAAAQEGETWNTLEPVYEVTEIQIHPNAEEDYLNNLRRTWATAMKEAKGSGLIEDYAMYSTLGRDDGYNLLLVIKYQNLAALDANEANKKKWKALEAKIEQRVPEEETRRITSTIYPNIREIHNVKLVRKFEFLE